jgi:hypothetical protein
VDLRNQHVKPDDADAEVKAEAALRLRIAGRSYRQIGRSMDLSHSRAYEIVIGRLQEIRSLNLELVEELRTLELARLDDMWRRMYPSPETPNAKIDAPTALALLRIVRERRAIAGLDVAPRFLPPVPEVPFTGAFDLDNAALTLEDLQDLERVTMRAMGLDPTNEVLPAPGSSAETPRPALAAVSAAAESFIETDETAGAIDHDPDTGYPVAVAIVARPSPTYLPE